MNKRPVRIANFSGYFGDRYTAIDEVMAGDPVDVLMGDYLAEITLAALAKGYLRNPQKGYVEYFIAQITPHLPALSERGCKVVTNAGGFNPAALAAALRTLIAEQRLDLRVAHVDGDNILAELPALQAAGHHFENLDTGAPLASWGHQPIVANAYLGGWGIAAALEGGADIVVCGRVTDASLTSGPAAWWHGWKRDQWHQLASAVVAGHVIECGGHATGGNFSGFRAIPNRTKPGFPIAEVAADGTTIITKHVQDGGAVTCDTVTAQLLYEIQGPRYLNPDVTAHIDTIELAQIGEHRVQISNVKGSPPPPTTKVAVFAQIGFQIVKLVFATGLNIDEKIDFLRAQLEDFTRGSGIDELSITKIGTPASEPRSQWDATVTLRIMATARDEVALRSDNFALKVDGLYLSSFPGFYTDTATLPVLNPRPRIEYWPALLTMHALRHRVVLDDGHEIIINPPDQSATSPQPSHPEPKPAKVIDATLRPLGEIAFARCGDKGGNSNIGIWAASEDAWPWLRSTLSTEKFRELFPDAGNKRISRHEFPHLKAVHFVVHGLFGNGGSSNLRVDQIGKAIGEYILSRPVMMPSAF
jgi:hypothetical protein